LCRPTNRPEGIVLTEALDQRAIFSGFMQRSMPRLVNLKSGIHRALAPVKQEKVTRGVREGLWGLWHLAILSYPAWAGQLSFLGPVATGALWGLWGLGVVISAMTLHEAAHAWQASRTPGVEVDAERLSLSPLAHFGGTASVLKEVTAWTRGRVSAARQAWYVAAGPGVQAILLAVGILGIWAGIPEYRWTLGVNAILMLWALLPIRMSDGVDEIVYDGAQLLYLVFGVRVPVLAPNPLFGALAASCPAMEIAYVSRFISRGLDKKRPVDMKAKEREAGRAFVRAARPYVTKLAEVSRRPDLKVSTILDPDTAEHAASHAVQDAVEAAVRQRDFSREKFRLKVKERMVEQLLSHDNGALSGDGRQTVQSVMSAMDEAGFDFGAIADSWQENLGILRNLSEVPDGELRALEAGPAHEHDHGAESGHMHGVSGALRQHLHLATPLDALWRGLRRALWSMGMTVSTKPQEDPYVWLQSELVAGGLPELTKDEMDLLKDMTDYAPLYTDNPLMEQPEVTGRIVAGLNTPYGHPMNLMVIGEQGVGKTSQIQLINQKLAAGLFDGPINHRRLVRLAKVPNPANPAEGKKLEALRDVLVKTKGRIILYVDEAHRLSADQNGQPNFFIANMLKEDMASGRIFVVGATTRKEYRKYIQPDGAYDRRWQKVEVPEPSDRQSLEILKGYKDTFERDFENLEVSDAAMDEMVRLAGVYLQDEYFPAKAVDHFRNVCKEVSGEFNQLTSDLSATVQQLQLEVNDYIRMGKKDQEQTPKAIRLYNHILALADQAKALEKRRAELRGTKRVTPEAVRSYVETLTKTKITAPGTADAAKYLEAEDRLSKRVVGQDRAIGAIANALRQSRSGLKDPKKPIGSFIFAGTTGVGKTELARALADFEFGDEKALVRFDMSEYQEKHTVSRLIGSPPGYVGHDEGGQLTEKVKKRPYSVVLFDEIEKAHPDVLKIALQMLDDGRLTDGQGNTVSFKNTIIIMTTNLGTHDPVLQTRVEAKQRELEKTQDPVRMNEIIAEMNAIVAEGVEAGLNRELAPELLNRFDGKITFNVLTPPVVRQIVRIQMTNSLAPLLKLQNYDLTFDEAVQDYLAKEGFHPLYGGRPLQRAINECVKVPLSKYLLANPQSSENSAGAVVHLYMDGGKVAFRLEPKPVEAVARNAPSAEAKPLADKIEKVVLGAEQTISRESIEKIIDVRLNGKASKALDLGVVKGNQAFAISAADVQSGTTFHKKKTEDKGVTTAHDQILTLLQQRQASAEMIAAFEAWFAEFVWQAKRFSEETSVKIQWGWDPAKGLQVVIDQGNSVTPAMEQALVPSLRPSPTNEDEALDAEEEIAGAGQEFRRSLMTAKMAVSKVAGATCGWAGSQYWLELPATSGTAGAVPSVAAQPSTVVSPSAGRTFAPALPNLSAAPLRSAGIPVGSLREGVARSIALNNPSEFQALNGKLTGKSYSDILSALGVSAGYYTFRADDLETGDIIIELNGDGEYHFSRVEKEVESGVTAWAFHDLHSEMGRTPQTPRILGNDSPPYTALVSTREDLERLRVPGDKKTSGGGIAGAVVSEPQKASAPPSVMTAESQRPPVALAPARRDALDGQLIPVGSLRERIVQSIMEINGSEFQALNQELTGKSPEEIMRLLGVRANKDRLESPDVEDGDIVIELTGEGQYRFLRVEKESTFGATTFDIHDKMGKLPQNNLSGPVRYWALVTTQEDLERFRGPGNKRISARYDDEVASSEAGGTSAPEVGGNEAVGAPPNAATEISEKAEASIRRRELARAIALRYRPAMAEILTAFPGKSPQDVLKLLGQSYSASDSSRYDPINKGDIYGRISDTGDMEIIQMGGLANEFFGMFSPIRKIRFLTENMGWGQNQERGVDVLKRQKESGQLILLATAEEMELLSKIGGADNPRNANWFRKKLARAIDRRDQAELETLYYVLGVLTPAQAVRWLNTANPNPRVKAEGIYISVGQNSIEDILEIWKMDFWNRRKIPFYEAGASFDDRNLVLCDAKGIALLNQRGKEGKLALVRTRWEAGLLRAIKQVLLTDDGPKDPDGTWGLLSSPITQLGPRWAANGLAAVLYIARVPQELLHALEQVLFEDVSWKKAWAALDLHWKQPVTHLTPSFQSALVGVLGNWALGLLAANYLPIFHSGWHILVLYLALANLVEAVLSTVPYTVRGRRSDGRVMLDPLLQELTKTAA